MKYVIRNCGCNSACDECYTRCKDITDCLLKQIVELCREQITIECNIDGKKQVLNAYYHTHLGEKILELLEIEEVDA